MINPNYTVNFGVDPLLQNPYSPNNVDYEREIEDRMRKLQAMKEQYIQVKQHTATNSLWTEIDREVSSLTEDQRNILFNSETYSSIDIELKLLIQQALINSVKSVVESSEVGKDLLTKQLNFIKSSKDKIVAQSNKEIEMFKKFQIAAKANPELTYKEFIKTINDK